MTIETISQNRSHGGVQGFYARIQETGNHGVRGYVRRMQTAQGARALLPRRPDLHRGNVTDEGRIPQSRLSSALCSSLPTPAHAAPTSPAKRTSEEFGEVPASMSTRRKRLSRSNYRMCSYVTKELPKLIGEICRGRDKPQAVIGHSMGGHGALTVALRKNPQRYAPSARSRRSSHRRGSLGHKALTGISAPIARPGASHDTVALIEDGAKYSGSPGRRGRGR